MTQFGKLRFRLTPFLEVKIDPIVDSLDYDFFPPFTGKEDKGKISMT